MTKKTSTKKFKFKYKKIHLSWYDAKSDSGWLTMSEMKKHKPAICHTQGWVFENNSKFIKIFGTYSIDEDDQSIDFGEIICVPKIWIV
jgi:hypothetical protein